MIVELAPEALEDLHAAIDYLAERNPRAARRLADRVFVAIDRLAEGLEGPAQVLRSGVEVRSWPVRPLRVYYRREADRLIVLRIYHQARRPIAKQR